MKKDLLKKNGNILSIDENGNTTSLSEAVGILAIATYEEYVEFCKKDNEEEKKRLKEKIVFQSNLLDSLSGALAALAKKPNTDSEKQLIDWFTNYNSSNKGKDGK